MHESRLFKIIYYLLDKGQATASELAEKFEVSIRTIYRDVESLSEAGIPIYTEAGRNGGIRLLEEFVLDKAILSDYEKQNILTVLKSINDTDTLSKLSALFNTDSDNWLEVDLSRWGSKQGDTEKFDLLKSAVINHKKVKITYAGSCENIRERIIMPLKLMYKKSWYLKAYCTEKQDFRLFKLTRILNLSILNESFLPILFPEDENSSNKNINCITLRFPKEMAYRVFDEFDETQVSSQPNGDLIAKAEMPEDAWLIGFLLSFGANVEVIEPAYLKQVLADQAQQIYKKNKI